MSLLRYIEHIRNKSLNFHFVLVQKPRKNDDHMDIELYIVRTITNRTLDQFEHETTTKRKNRGKKHVPCIKNENEICIKKTG